MKYTKYFIQADKNKTGKISNSEARVYFLRSKLPK